MTARNDDDDYTTSGDIQDFAVNANDNDNNSMTRCLGLCCRFATFMGNSDDDISVTVGDTGDFTEIAEDDDVFGDDDNANDDDIKDFSQHNIVMNANNSRIIIVTHIGTKFKLAFYW